MQISITSRHTNLNTRKTAQSTDFDYKIIAYTIFILLHKYYIVCSRNSIKIGTNRTDVFDGSNKSLYHADEVLYTRFPIHSPSKLIVIRDMCGRVGHSYQTICIRNTTSPITIKVNPLTWLPNNSVTS